MKLKEMSSKIYSIKYPIEIHWIDESDGNGYYFAYLPDWGWSAISATADTLQEVLEELDDARKDIIEYYLATNKTIPNASSIPIKAVK